jgi:hypothetical protein
VTDNTQLALVERVLREEGIEWNDLRRRCDQIVLFGSWAVSAQDKESDLDLLCVGFGRRLKTRRLDLVWCAPEFLLSQEWLGSELASHISKFGVWLHGHDNWRKYARISEDVICVKRHLIRCRVGALQRMWQRLAPDYRVKHVVKFRRDVQRLVLMKAGIPTPPNRLLDERWVNLGASRAALLRLLHESDEPELIDAGQLTLICDLLAEVDWRKERRTLSSIPQAE